MSRNETLFLTSSFPRFEGDYAGSFVAESVSAYRALGPLCVLAPQDRLVDPDWRPADAVLERFGSRLTLGPSPFYGDGGPENMAHAERVAMVPYAATSMLRHAQRLAPGSARIVSHWMIPAGVVGASLRRPDRPHQLIVHGGGWHTLKRSRAGRMLARWVLMRSDDIVAVAAYLREELLSLFESRIRETMAARIRTSPMGLHTSLYQRECLDVAHSRPCRVAGVGRLSPIKRFDRLIHAMRGASGELWLVGDGPERARLSQLAHATNVAVRFFGARRMDETARIMKRCDVLAIPSDARSERQEGTPRVALEGMAAGMALIANPSGGLADLIEHDRSGLLADTSGPTFARELSLLMGDAPRRTRLGQGAQTRAQTFDWSRIGPTLATGFMGGDARC